MNYNPRIHHRRSIRLKGYDYSQAGAYFITICCHDRECRFGKISIGAGFTTALNTQDEKGQPREIPPTNAPDVGAGFASALNITPQMILNEYGIIAYNEWLKLPDRFPNFELDVFQIMPNHMHTIILLKSTENQTREITNPIHSNTTDVGAGLAPALNTPDRKGQPRGIAPTNAPDIGAGFTSGHNITSHTVGEIIGAYKSLVANACLDIYKSNNEDMGKLWQRNFHEHIIRDEQSYQKIADYIVNNPPNWENDKFYSPY